MSSSQTFRCSVSYRRARTLVALLLLAGPFLACGKKGNPMPAPRTIPQAATDLKVRQRGLEVVAEFAYPKATVAGLPLAGLDELTLFALDRPLATVIAPAPAPVVPAAPPADLAATPATPTTPTTPTTPAGAVGTSSALVMPDLREFAASAQPFLVLSGAELASAISGDRITVRFRLPEPLAADLPARIFSVRTHAVGGETSDWSNLAGLLPRTPPPPPSSFLAVAAKNGIELSWAAAATSPAISGFNVYRRDAARTSYGEPIATLDATAASTTDTGVAYGRRYIYALTAIGSREPLSESALSAEREIDFQDRFAPLPPRELTALGSAGEVRLVWQASPDSDVAGYVIERADPDADFHRVNAEPVADLEFTDRGLSSGFIFRFRVAAIDNSGNLGPPGEPIATRVP